MATKVEVELSLINRLTNGLNKATGDFKRFELNAKKSIASVGAGWNKLLSLQNVIYGVGTGALVKSTIDASMAFQGLQNSMQAAVGQFTNANTELELIRSESNRIGVDFEKVSGDYIKFAASATRAGISLQKTRDIFTDLSETAVSLRLTPERTRLVFEALNQMASKGTVQMEELRGQLGDHIPAALNLAAKAMGVTAGEFYKMVKDGRVLAADFLPKFAKTVREDMGGGFETATQQLQANLSRLGNAWFQFRVKLGDTFTPDLLEGVKALTGQIDKLAVKTGELRLKFEELSAPFVLLWNGTQMGVDAFMYLAEAVTTIIPSIGLRVRNGFEAIVGIYSDYRNVFKTFFTDAMSGIDPKTGKTRRNEFEPALAKFTSGQSFTEFKTRMGLIKNEAQTTDDYLAGLLSKYNDKFEKNISDVKVKLDRYKSALRDRSAAQEGEYGFMGPSKPGGPYSGVPSPAAYVDEEKLKKKAAAWESWITKLEGLSTREETINRRRALWMFNLQGLSEKEGAENQKKALDLQIKQLEQQVEAYQAYEDVYLNSMAEGADRELEMNRVKYERMQKDYQGNKTAMMLIEDAFYVEQHAIEKRRAEDQQAAAKSWVDTVTQSLMTIAGENKKFVGLYKTAAIAQIVADTIVAAQSAYKSMVQSFGAYGIPAGIAAAAVVTAAGAARAGIVAKQKFGLGVREYRARGPQMIMVGDNPGGEETVTVRPTSSPNVNGTPGSSGGDTHYHFYDKSGDLVESFRRRVRSGGADQLTRELFCRGRMIGATT